MLVGTNICLSSCVFLFLISFSAAYALLETYLRLIYAFAECGPQYNQLVNTGYFPSLVRTLHQSDVAYHGQAQVILDYYEVGFVVFVDTFG